MPDLYVSLLAALPPVVGLVVDLENGQVCEWSRFYLCFL